MRAPLPPLLFAVLTLWVAAPAIGHPMPDLPVRASFDAGGAATVAVEIETRCFVEDPLTELYLLNWVLEEMTEAEREDYRAQARDFMKRSVEFRFEPSGVFSPEFDFAFTTFGGAPLEKIDDPVVITGTWRGDLPEGTRGYQLRAQPECRFGVMFENELRGEKLERVQVLFPGESSHVLDLTTGATAAPGAPAAGLAGDAGANPPFLRSIAAGFAAVLPFGFEHILFVVGLFLLSRRRAPLLWQFIAFTAAHSLTLALATLDAVHVPASVFQPLIAASVAVVAIANLFHPDCNRWRLAIVFACGLVHGLGFAAALAESGPPAGSASLLAVLAGFTAGIVGGHSAVIAIAFAATAWLRNPDPYRRFVAVPGSLAIAVAGVFWLVARIAGS